ncbi:Dual specificity protein phosphatase 22 [Echinococcus granulosus]|uniref:Dual specificity protein phosphatase n=1 Tax=Echinococcus granulosus TaxID=6210 RepID=A0A068X1E7_ECHGR|nr:Dual specificity protein phosphatase 22 [Echinococcus granulosus]CDS23747.1 dual specificity protein phosphatase [Echinococcus granulosus]
MGGVMSSIVPGVYVGGLTSARSESELNHCQITHICSAFQYPLSLDPKRVHKQFIIQDSPEEDIAKYFVDAIDFIHGARVNHGTVLIHCACGISRSVSLTMAYLLCITDFKLRDIYKGLRAARLGACPNYGFLRQLQRFEESGDYLKARQFLIAKYGPWSPEKLAADRAAMETHIAAQEAFIQTGYYPWDGRPPSAPATGEKGASARFICRLRA